MNSSIPPNTDNRLVEFIRDNQKILVLSGAGISTASGIPDYRDKDGQWKRKKPIDHNEFINSQSVRQRYWARSLLGWRYFGKAEPNKAHHALVDLEKAGLLSGIITQNVDGLHQKAGSREVIDLHGRISDLLCLNCDYRVSRAEFQQPLAQANPNYQELAATIAPDGDADLNLDDFSDFRVPACPVCGGTIMPDVVFYGGSVPRSRVERGMQALQNSGALLVIGSSLTVYSSYRYCLKAQQLNIPIGVVNIGFTRADELIAFKLEQPCEQALAEAAEKLCKR